MSCLVTWGPTVEVEGNPTHIVDSSGAGFAWICNAAGTDCSESYCRKSLPIAAGIGLTVPLLITIPPARERR